MANYLFTDAGRDNLEKSGLARFVVFNKHSLTEPLSFSHNEALVSLTLNTTLTPESP